MFCKQQLARASRWANILQANALITKQTGVDILNSELWDLQKSAAARTLVRLFKMETLEPPSRSGEPPGSASTGTADSGAGLINVLNGIKSRLSARDEKPIPAVHWKTTSPKISKTSVSSRMKHILWSITTAESDDSRLRRIEDLSVHLLQHPESKHNAVKEGAIRMLRSIRHRTKNSDIKAAISEACALLGYIDALPNRGIRILSIDGGGVRGLLVIQMLKRLEHLTGRRVHELFDYVCGVSTGAILSCSIGALKEDLDMLEERFKDISTRIFTQSTLKGTSSLVWSHSYYDTDQWETLLRAHMGEDTLIRTTRDPRTPKLATISAVVNQEHVSAYVFRNYSFPWRIKSQYLGGNEHKVWEAARASAAAPTYFGECKLGNLLHQDGGILVNNPTAVAIHEAKLLWPGQQIQCVVSFGTGRTVPTPSESQGEDIGSISSWRNKFMKILDSATDTEGVHTTLSDLLPDNVYFRFNPYLTEMVSMSEVDPQKLEQLERDALMYLRRNDDKFKEAARSLTEPRTVFQKCLDFVAVNKEAYGL